MKYIANTFFKGLLLTLPLVITIGLIYWLLAAGEQLFKVPLQAVLPHGWYVPGMGVLCALVIIFVLGVVAQAYLIKHFFAALESVVLKIPVVKTLYGSSKDLINLFAGEKDSQMQKVVAITVNDMKLIGFVTNEDAALGEDSDRVAVYLPMSYQVGGYLLYVRKDQVEPLDIPVQQAMQQVLTAHIGRGKKTQ